MGPAPQRRTLRRETRLLFLALRPRLVAVPGRLVPRNTVHLMLAEQGPSSSPGHGAAPAWETPAILAAVILATSFEFCNLSQTGAIDTTLTLLTTLSIVFFLRMTEEESPAGGSDSPPRRSCSLLSPFSRRDRSARVPLLSVLPSRRWDAMEADALGGGNPPQLAALLPAVLWVLAGGRTEGLEYVERMIWKQNVAGLSIRRATSVPVPTTFCTFPSSSCRGFSWSRWSSTVCSEVGAAPAKAICGAPPGVAIPWFLAVFLFFSAMSGKRTRYILRPILPRRCSSPRR